MHLAIVTKRDTCKRFDVLTAVTMKISVFWDIMLVDIYHYFRGTCCLHFQDTLEVEAAGKYKITWSHPRKQ
jgi:hypothetical protein